MLLDINLYIFIYTAHTETGTVGQRMTGAVMRETETLYSALTKGEGLEMDAVNVGRTSLLPLIARRPISSSSPRNPRDAHMLGAGTHPSLLGFVCVDLWNSRTEQKRWTDRHACEVAKDTASWHTSAFFLLNHLSYCFLLLLFSLFFLSILVLSTKIILNVVLSLSLPLFFPLT